MPYTADWYIENEIIYVHYTGAVTQDDIRGTFATANQFIERSPRHIVHLITDVGDITKPLNPKDSLEAMRDITFHPRFGWTIILREKSVLVKIGVMFGSSLFKVRNKTLASMSEAHAFLSESDPNLSWDKANASILASS
ncbi:MAG: hypothetical protein R3E39_23545 [Anaerolineae bacterium]